jgi:quinohemoprotein ethanol dehydrogenase
MAVAAAGLGAAALALAAQAASAPQKLSAKPAASRPAAAAKPAARKAAPAARPWANVDGARIANADKEPGQWLSVGRTYDEQRFSPLTQINTGNVKNLGLAWYADLGSTRGVEASPLFIDGVIYNTLPWNITEAYDAKTGKRLWRYDPKVPQQYARLACCDIDARGLAAWKGKIISATLDGRLIALDAKTGKELWSVQTIDEGPTKWAWTVTGAPRVFDGKVLIGNAGAEAAAPGWLTAYDVNTGKKLWRFHVVPPNPANGNLTKAEKIAAPTWKGEWWKNGGGGTPWDSIVYDPKAKLVYVGTGNGGPWVQDYRSPGGGDNLFLASVVALHVEDGEYAWHYQETPGDEWDYTSTQPMILADLKIDGRDRQVLMHAPKNGFFYVLDRITGELISAEPYVDGITWAKGIDKKTGRPIENPAARYGEKPVLLSPGPGGAHNWHPMAYNPQTGLVYFPVVQSSAIYAKDPKFVLEPGRMSQLGLASTGYEEERKALFASAPKSEAYLVAYDPVKQKQVWRAPYSRTGSGGVLTTAGNLVFQGTIGSTFAAYDARTGAKLWEMPAQQVPIAAPITYMVDGVQYVAVNAGYGGGINHGPVTDDSQLQITDYGRLLVYKLGGAAKLPPVVFVKATIDPPPNIRGSNFELQKGGEIYAKNCSGCHGDNARGGIKDLRRMSAQTHAEFFDIVLGGKRKEKGMASFADVLTRQDAELIQKFLIARINEDWTDLKNGK